MSSQPPRTLFCSGKRFPSVGASVSNGVRAAQVPEEGVTGTGSYRFLDTAKPAALPSTIPSGCFWPALHALQTFWERSQAQCSRTGGV